MTEDGTLDENRRRLSQLAEHLSAGQLEAVIVFAQFLLADPVSRAMSNAPYDERAMLPAVEAALQEGRESIRLGSLVEHDEVLREFGL